MLCQEEVCEATSRIKLVAEEYRGGRKGYTAGHVLEALRLLKNSGPLGRPRLTRLLGIGESSTKTLLTRMEFEGLVERSGRGHFITESGLRTLELIESHLKTTPMKAPEGVFDTPEDEAVLTTSDCVPPPANLTQVYIIRDYLVLSGCRQSIIGGVSDGELLFPGLPENLLSVLRQRISVESLFNRGVIIVSPRKCEREVVHGMILFIHEYCTL